MSCPVSPENYKDEVSTGVAGECGVISSTLCELTDHCRCCSSPSPSASPSAWPLRCPPVPPGPPLAGLCPTLAGLLLMLTGLCRMLAGLLLMPRDFICIGAKSCYPINQFLEFPQNFKNKIKCSWCQSVHFLFPSFSISRLIYFGNKPICARMRVQFSSKQNKVFG